MSIFTTNNREILSDMERKYHISIVNPEHIFEFLRQTKNDIYRQQSIVIEGFLTCSSVM